MLQYYGNLSVLADTYDAAADFCAFLDTAPAGAIENGLGDWMGIEVRMSRAGEIITYIITYIILYNNSKPPADEGPFIDGARLPGNELRSIC